MQIQKIRFFPIGVGLIFLLLLTLPYWLAFQAGPPELAFGGFLLNPLDGNSYLAKMQQGWQGQWRFRLPFTADPGAGAFLFLFYLFLGHLARWLGQPLLAVFHAARLLAALFLLDRLWRLTKSVFADDSNSANFAFALAAFGAGMGWLLIPAGYLPADFWVAEAYPFLSAYANPHFPLGLGLVLLLITESHQPRTASIAWFSILGGAAFLLSWISPFGVVIVLMILGGRLVWGWLENSFPTELFILGAVIAVGGLPVMLYDLWIANSDPALASWNAQNLTPSPPIWDFLLSLSPAIVLALFALVQARKNAPISASQKSLIVWAVLGSLLVFVPLSLQRRFMMGLYVPLSLLAVLGIETIAAQNRQRFRRVAVAVFSFSGLTNLIILAAALAGIAARDPQIYLSAAEIEVLNWINANTASDTVVLAGPETGLLIPAYTGRRVVYGHPFETVDAASEQEFVTRFFEGDLPAVEMAAALQNKQVDLIWLGPREKALGAVPILPGWQLVYSHTDIALYGVRK